MHPAARGRGSKTRLCAWAVLGASTAALGCDRQAGERPTVRVPTSGAVSPDRADRQVRNEAEARMPAGSAQARLPQTEAPWRELGPDLYVTDSDRNLAARIRRAISPDNTAQAFSQVQVMIRDGVVTLRGRVDTEIDRTLVRERAAAVAGPRAVYDLMDMK